MTTEGAEIQCEDVVRSYVRGSSSRLGRLFGRSTDRPQVDAVDGISCTIERGEYVGISGPSGSGKSTLLHLMAGLDTPTSGRVIVNGTDIGTFSRRERARYRLGTVGVVFQHFHLLDALSARGNVAVPLVEQGVGKSERRRRATELLETVGLDDRLSHKPRELSGGEQQRVAIARALATDPALVIADEPTGELDSETAQRVLDVFESIAGERTVVVASHDRQTLESTNRRLALADGRCRQPGGDAVDG